MDGPVLVTGATGFLGRHLIMALTGQGTRVRATVRNDHDAAGLAAAGVDCVRGDLRDPAVIAQAVAGARGVFHLAGRLFSPDVDPRRYQELHVQVPAALLRACATLDRMNFFVLCSTTGVHGPTPGRRAREDDPGRPDNAYEQSKAEGERIALAISSASNLPLTIARPSLVYGPGDLHLLGWFRAIARRRYAVIGAGLNRLHPVFIEDLVRGLVLCAEVGQRGRAYHLVGPRTVTMRELSEAIGFALDRPINRLSIPRGLAYAVGACLERLPVAKTRLPLTRSRVRFMTQERQYDGARAAEELGFTGAVDLDQGLPRTVAWYRHNGLL